jgi:hypothetical protein
MVIGKGEIVGINVRKTAGMNFGKECEESGFLYSYAYAE